MAQFRFLTGDVNWRTYGGTWYHASRYGSTPKETEFTFVEFINWEGETGTRYRERGETETFTYVVETSQVDLAWYTPDQIKSALDCCGITQDALKGLTPFRRRLETAHAIKCYSGGDQDTIAGNNAYALLRQAKRRAA